MIVVAFSFSFNDFYPRENNLIFTLKLLKKNLKHIA